MNTENLLILMLFIACGGLNPIAEFLERMSRALTLKEFYSKERNISNVNASE